jgi:hypothetical protein
MNKELLLLLLLKLNNYEQFNASFYIIYLLNFTKQEILLNNNESGSAALFSIFLRRNAVASRRNIIRLGP